MKSTTYITIALAIAASPVAGQMAGQVDGIASAQLLVGGQMQDGRLLAALHITLTPDWKTYWRSPGAGGGIPPQFDWSGSANLGEVALMWPTPEVWGDAGLENIGYGGTLTVPMAITPQDAGQPVAMAMQVDLGVCKDICVPARVDLAGRVDAAALYDPIIMAAMANLPTPAADIDGAVWRCSTAPIKDGMQVSATITLPNLGADETVIIEHRLPNIWASGATVTRLGDQIQAVVDLVPPQAAPFDISSDDLRLTVLTNGRAVEMQGCPLN